MLDTLRQDLRYALRQLRRSPGFAAVAILTLALGIGANTAIFSVVDAVLLRPLPYPASGRLVELSSASLGGGPGGKAAGGSMSYPDLENLRTLTGDFSGIAAYGSQRYNLVWRDRAREVRAVFASADLFRVLGVSPAVGRTFTQAEKRDQDAVLSYGMWETDFGGDPGVVGRTLTLDGRSFTILGVMPRGFAFPDAEAQMWVPIGEALRQNPQLEFNRHFYFFRTVARLAPGASVARARADMEAMARHIASGPSGPPGGKGGGRRVELRVAGGGPPGGSPGGGPKILGRQGPEFEIAPLKAGVVGDVRPALLVLFGAVALVLLIACANAAGLLVARAARRRREIAVRRALGASRGRLARQLLTESVVLGLLAGGLGVLLSWWGVGALVGMWPSLPRAGSIGIDLPVLGFALLLSVVTGLAFGMLPALKAAAPALEGELRDEGSATTGSRGRHRTQSTLVVAELALALVLLVGSGLLIRSFVHLLNVDPGYDTRDVLAAPIRLTPTRYPDIQQQNDFFQRLTSALRRDPGVADISTSRTLPLSGSVQMMAFDPRQVRPDDSQPFMVARLNVVGPGYFATTGIKLLRGRDFTRDDRADAPRVVIVNQSLARELWPGQDPVGKTFPMHTRAGAYDASVVGVIADVHFASLEAPLMAGLYVPQLQWQDESDSWVVLKARRSPLSLVGSVRTAVRQIDPEQPIGEMVSLDQELARSTATRRLDMTLLTLFAGLALLLALVGIYGLTAYAVTQRTRELGLRLAIGARPGDVVRMLLRENASLVAVGLLLGVGGAVVATRVLRSMVFGVSTLDLATFAGAALLLACVTLAATYVPARRAARIDPLEALRHE